MSISVSMVSAASAERLIETCLHSLQHGCGALLNEEQVLVEGPMCIHLSSFFKNVRCNLRLCIPVALLVCLESIIIISLKHLETPSISCLQCLFAFYVSGFFFSSSNNLDCFLRFGTAFNHCNVIFKLKYAYR